MLYPLSYEGGVRHHRRSEPLRVVRGSRRQTHNRCASPQIVLTSLRNRLIDPLREPVEVVLKQVCIGVESKACVLVPQHALNRLHTRP